MEDELTLRQKKRYYEEQEEDLKKEIATLTDIQQELEDDYRSSLKDNQQLEMVIHGSHYERELLAFNDEEAMLHQDAIHSISDEIAEANKQLKETRQKINQLEEHHQQNNKEEGDSHGKGRLRSTQ